MNILNSFAHTTLSFNRRGAESNTITSNKSFINRGPIPNVISNRFSSTKSQGFYIPKVGKRPVTRGAVSGGNMLMKKACNSRAERTERSIKYKLITPNPNVA